MIHTLQNSIIESMETLKYTKVREVRSPVRGTSGAAGIDFFVPTDIDKQTMDAKCDVTQCYPDMEYADGHLTKIWLKPGESVMIPSGIKMKVPSGHALALMNKSGVGAKKQLDRLAELVDCDYEGEVHLNIVNNGLSTQCICAGDKIIQGVIIPVNFAAPEEVEDEEALFKGSTSERKSGGFGSTGN